MNACRQWAEREGYEPIGPYVDHLSGSAALDKRLGLIDALAELRKGDVLLTAKRDRLARDPLVIAMVEAEVCKKGCRIVSAAGEGTHSDDPAEVLMRRIVDAFSEYERLLIRARTRAAARVKRQRGERWGQVAYGTVLVDSNRLAADPAELAVIEEIKARRARGETLRGLAAWLETKGVPTKSGKPWSFSTVRSILERSA